MNYQEFKKKWYNKGVDVDGYFYINVGTPLHSGVERTVYL